MPFCSKGCSCRHFGIALHCQLSCTNVLSNAHLICRMNEQRFTSLLLVGPELLSSLQAAASDRLSDAVASMEIFLAHLLSFSLSEKTIRPLVSSIRSRRT